MNRRLIPVAAVLLLVLVVGGAFLLVGLLRGDDTDLEKQPVKRSAPDLVVSASTPGSRAAAVGSSA